MKHITDLNEMNLFVIILDLNRLRIKSIAGCGLTLLYMKT